MIEAAGASLLFLPPYSPDFNPLILFEPIECRNHTSPPQDTMQRDRPAL